MNCLLLQHSSFSETDLKQHLVINCAIWLITDKQYQLLLNCHWVLMQLLGNNMNYETKLLETSHFCTLNHTAYNQKLLHWLHVMNTFWVIIFIRTENENIDLLFGDCFNCQEYSYLLYWGRSSWQTWIQNVSNMETNVPTNGIS